MENSPENTIWEVSDTEDQKFPIPPSSSEESAGESSEEESSDEEMQELPQVKESARPTSSIMDSEQEETGQVNSSAQSQKVAKLKFSRVAGPDRPCPKNIIKLLEEWHKKYLKEKPHPCSWSGPSGNEQIYSVEFNKHGQKVDITAWLIEGPIKYWTQVLHESPDTGKLLANSSVSSAKRTFLVQWLGVGEEYDKECCAVRIHNRDRNKIIIMPPEIWEEAPDDPKPRRYPRGTRDARNSKVPKPAQKPAQKPAEKPAEKPTEKPTETQEEPRRSKRKSQAVTDTRDKPESSSAINNEESAQDGAHASNPNKRKRSTPSRNNNTLRQAPTQSTPIQSTPIQSTSIPLTPAQPTLIQSIPTQSFDISFKLVPYIMNNIRSFDAEDVKNGAELFEKARQFFRGFDKEAKVTILSCRFENESDKRRVYEGEEGDFRHLIKQAKKMAQKTGDDVTIEVTPVD